MIGFAYAPSCLFQVHKWEAGMQGKLSSLSKLMVGLKSSLFQLSDLNKLITTENPHCVNTCAAICPPLMTPIMQEMQTSSNTVLPETVVISGDSAHHGLNQYF